MEARITARAASFAAGSARSLRMVFLLVLLVCSMGASVRSRNFIIQTDDPAMARQFSETAERCRRELAVSWLGKEMPDWAAPCVMSVRVGPNLGAGGSTSFVFDRGEVFGWRMSIQGSRERVIDSVLPHEITHMILASHFRRPLPRWADEGAATSTEYEGELKKHKRMLNEFLTTGRGLPFNRMFAMTEYPRDVMPLYAQGFSVVDYLVELGGRRKFIDYLGEAMETERWGDTAKKYYGIASLGEMQHRWLAWVREGSPRLDRAPEVSSEIMLAGASNGSRAKATDSPAPSRSIRPTGVMLAAATQPGTMRSRETLPAVASAALAGRRPWPEPNLIHRIPRNTAPGVGEVASAGYDQASSGCRPGEACEAVGCAANTSIGGVRAGDPRAAGTWRPGSCGMTVPEATEMVPVVFARPRTTVPAEGWQAPRESIASASGPVHSEMARPQPVEQAREIILEWSKSGIVVDDAPAANGSLFR